jgi:hypothetical protein
MKLLKTLKNIMLENRAKEHRLFTTPNGLKFLATTHQTFDREGNLSYEDIKDIILNAIDSGIKVHTRVGVPNRMLSRLIREKYEIMLYEFSKNPKEEKIKFVYERNDNEDDPIFDFIEFIVGRGKEDDTFFVVSSTFSKNGDYLKLYGKDVTQARKIILEKYFHIRTVLL